MGAVRGRSKTIMRIFVAATCALAAVLVVAQAAAAQGTVCTGVLTGVVAGDVVVPAGSSCTLEDAAISGSVTVESEAQLSGYAAIGGSIELDTGALLYVSDSTIGHDVVCRGCRLLKMLFMYGIGGDISVTAMTNGYLNWDGVPVAGSVKVTGNSGDFTVIDSLAEGNFIFAENVGPAGFWYSGAQGGNLEIVRNSGEFHLESTYSRNLIFSDNVGPSELTFNYAAKHLQCFRNEPAPTGYYNEAGKTVAGQCAALGPDAYPD